MFPGSADRRAAGAHQGDAGAGIRGRSAGTLYIAWKGNQSGRIGYKASFDKAALTAQELLPRAVTSTGAALTVRGYTLFVAWTDVGASGRILYTRANDPY